MNPIERRASRLGIGLTVASSIVALGLAIAAGSLVIEPPDAPTSRAEKLQQAKAQQSSVKLAAEKALRASPLDARALRVLALSEADADEDRAAQMMIVSDRLSRRDAPAQAWLLERSLKTSNLVSAYQHIDALLRVRPELAQALEPVMFAAAASSPGVDGLAKRLSLAPPWRTDFMARLAEIAPPSVTFSVLSRLNDGSKPATFYETGAFLRRLVNMGAIEQAQLVWLLSLDPNQLAALNGVYDGDFNRMDGPYPFVWAFEASAAGRAAIEVSLNRPGDPALHATYDGFTTTRRLASQTIILPPGEHQLSGETMTQTPTRSDQFTWSVTCLDDGTELVRSATPPDRTWKRFSIPFTVPDTGCRAQVLELRTEAGDIRSATEVWYDKLFIESASRSS